MRLLPHPEVEQDEARNQGCGQGRHRLVKVRKIASLDLERLRGKEVSENLMVYLAVDMRESQRGQKERYLTRNAPRRKVAPSGSPENFR